MKSPAAGITCQNQSMLVETDRGAALHTNVILTHSDPTYFLFGGQYSTYNKNGVVGDLPAQNFHKPGIFLQHKYRGLIPTKLKIYHF